MKYDFDSVTDRKHSNSLKWNVAENELPMWVADMDFKTAPEIEEAISNRMENGIFGYSEVTDEWYAAYMNWWKNRHNFRIEKEWLIFCTGVIPAISSIVRKITTPAEKVVIQTPVYNIFFNSILNNGRVVNENKLIYENGKYSIDFKDLEEKLSDEQTSLMILCNPQNPVGKIWSVEELSKIGELCAKYNVTVISDEIHCDIADSDKGYTPFASVSDVCKDISITCIAPTKAFNIAGLQTAAVVVPNPNLRHKVWRGLNTDEVAEPNAFAVQAAVAAFNKGSEWLLELNKYISDNKNIVINFVKENIPNLYVVPSEATYLLWIDCSKVCDIENGYDAEKLSGEIRKQTGLYLSAGNQYGSNGKEFLRMNIACPKSILSDGLNRLKAGISMIGLNEINN